MTRFILPSIALAQRNSEETTRSLHENTSRDRPRDINNRHLPFHGLDLEHGGTVSQTPVAQEAAEAESKHYTVLRTPGPV